MLVVRVFGVDDNVSKFFIAIVEDEAGSRSKNLGASLSMFLGNVEGEGNSVVDLDSIESKTVAILVSAGSAPDQDLQTVNQSRGRLLNVDRDVTHSIVVVDVWTIAARDEVALAGIRRCCERVHMWRDEPVPRVDGMWMVFGHDIARGRKFRSLDSV